ncbi:MAG: hypothetical protein NUV77_07675 [Thermoguttaceae bacterium]|jgi:hypothetical protein|nr:hypothetical protein [Thermoguttaceae bacterium]
MDAVQFAKDLVTLRDYLEREYLVAVRDKVLSRIDDYFLFAYRRGQLRYMPLSKVYFPR